MNRPCPARRLALAIVCLVGSPLVAAGGLADTPLPQFNDGEAAQLAFTIPTVVKNNQVETAVLCTNLAPTPVNLGVEVFDAGGTLGNTISAGNGAVLALAPGRTMTFATGATAVLHEDVLIALEAPVTALRQGSARVVATSGPLACVAFAVDSLHRIEDPNVCPDCPAPTLANLPTVTPCAPAACDDGNPCTIDDCDDAGACTHVPTSEGSLCDDGNACTTTDRCGTGVCSGTPVVCGDSPCDQAGSCDPGTGQCMGGGTRSACVPGGGKKSTDCAAEWVVDNPGNRKGITSRTQICRQGDASCDFDVAAAACTFHVRICLNNRDVNLPTCQAGEVSTYELRRPSPRAPKADQRADADVVLAAVEALAPSSRGGRRLNRVLFDPPDATANHCTAAVPLRVRVRRALVLKVRVDAPSGGRDTDKLKLKCTGSRRRRPSRLGPSLARVASSLLTRVSRLTASWL